MQTTIKPVTAVGNKEMRHQSQLEEKKAPVPSSTQTHLVTPSHTDWQ